MSEKTARYHESRDSMIHDVCSPLDEQAPYVADSFQNCRIYVCIYLGSLLRASWRVSVSELSSDIVKGRIKRISRGVFFS